MVVFHDFDANAKLETLCRRLGQQDCPGLTKLNLPPFFHVSSYHADDIIISLPNRPPSYTEAVAVNHCIMDELLRQENRVPQVSKVHTWIDELDEEVAARLCSYLTHPAAHVEHVVLDYDCVEAKRAPKRDDVVTAQLLCNGITLSTTVQTVELHRLTVQEDDIATLLHSNNASIRKLHLHYVVIRPAKNNCLLSAEGNTRISLEELTIDAVGNENVEGVSAVARLVQLAASSGSLNTATLSGFDDCFAASVFKSLARVQRVAFQSCVLTKNQMDELASGLRQHGRVKSLKFPYCSFSNDAETCVGEVVESAQGLECVQMGPLKSRIAQAGFLQGMRHNASIKSISITESSLRWTGKIAKEFKSFAANCSLVSLRFAASSGFNGGPIVLFDSLRLITSLRSLHVSGIRDSGPLASYIRATSSLQELTMEQCRMNNTHFTALLEAMTVNSTLGQFRVASCGVNYFYVSWTTILPKLKWLAELHLDLRECPDLFLEELLRGFKDNRSLLKFSANWDPSSDSYSRTTETYIFRNRLYRATLALDAPSGGKLLPRVLSTLWNLSTDPTLVLQALAQHSALLGREQSDVERTTTLSSSAQLNEQVHRCVIM